MFKKTLIALTAFAGVAGFLYYLAILGSETALMERFPHIDQKVVVKAHRQMVLNALRGEYKNFDLDDMTVMDVLFLNIVDTIN